MQPEPTKTDVRKQLRQFLADLAPAERRQRSQQATRHLLACDEYRRAEVVMVFLSLPSEVDTAPIVLDCWQHKKRVVAPMVSYESKRMVPVEINHFGQVHTDNLGLRQPVEGPPMPLDILDLVLVPGLGFDQQGQRIGRGGGFYDRFLSSPLLRATRCGLAFEGQFVDRLPACQHDQRVHLLVTEVGLRRFTDHGSSPLNPLPALQG